MNEDKPNKSKLTKREWAEVETKWASGDYTAKELGHAYGISAGQLGKKLAERGVKKGQDADKLVQKAREAVEADEAVKASETYHKINETKEEHYRYAQTVAKLTYTLIAKTVKSAQSLDMLTDQFKALKDASTIFAQTQKARWDVLGIDKWDDVDEAIPTLVVEDFTDEEIREIHKKNAGTHLFDDVDEEIAKAAEETIGEIEEILGEDDFKQ